MHKSPDFGALFGVDPEIEWTFYKLKWQRKVEEEQEAANSNLQWQVKMSKEGTLRTISLQVSTTSPQTLLAYR